MVPCEKVKDEHWRGFRSKKCWNAATVLVFQLRNAVFRSNSIASP